jgi:hypothetical protein
MLQMSNDVTPMRFSDIQTTFATSTLTESLAFWMKLVEAQHEFCIRYYRWATYAFRREITDSFPYLRAFKTGAAWSLVHFMDRLDLQRQITLASALLKRFHPEAVKSLEDHFNVAEEELYSQFSILRKQPSPLGEGILAKELSGHKVRYASRRKIRKQLIHQASSLLDSHPIIFSDSEIAFEKNCCGWVIVTLFDFGGRSDQVRYHHSIVSESKREPFGIPEAVLRRFISLHSWLGLSSETSWEYLVDDDIQHVCNCIMDSCRLFLDAAPKLLEGLGH